MREFFKPWRHRFGVATLVLACAFAVAWVRNFSLLDYIEIPIGNHISVFLATYRHYFAILIEFDPEYDLSSSAKWLSEPISQLTPDDLVKMNYVSLQSMIKYRNHPPVVPKGPNQPYRVPELGQDYLLLGSPIPYWSIVAPLTLLSAYLLLINPRPTKPKVEPIIGESHA